MDLFFKLLRVLGYFVQLPVVVFVFFSVVNWVFTGSPDQPPTRALSLAVVLILLNTLRI
jgi:hypothetical protein